MIGRTCRVDGVMYEAVPETDGCDGCAGAVPNTVCMALPRGCSDGGYIWIKAVEQGVSQFDGRHHATPSGLYKPAHGGYPDAVPHKRPQGAN